MGIGSRSLRSKAVRVIESSILGATAWDVCLVLLSFLHCISPLLLVVIFIFQQIATTRTNGKFIQRHVLGWVNIWKRLWNQNWTSNFLLHLNFGLYYEATLATEHWKWGCRGKYLLRYMSIFTSTESKIKVKPIFFGWAALFNLSGFAICKWHWGIRKYKMPYHKPNGVHRREDRLHSILGLCRVGGQWLGDSSLSVRLEVLFSKPDQNSTLQIVLNI